MKALKRRIKQILPQRIGSKWLLLPYLTKNQRNDLVATGDPVRYSSVYLAIEQVEKGNIQGSFAECGVYKGFLSKFIHSMVPHRQFYLFDTFKGFDMRNLKDKRMDSRFQDTSKQGVINYIGDMNNIHICEGYFPESAQGLEDQRFAFVVIDFDKYEPTVAALEFFYSRVNTGGFIFVHDYSSPESNWACSRALNEFLMDKPEKPILIPDAWGSAVFRKV